MTRTTSASRTSKPITTGELDRRGAAFSGIGGIGGVLESLNMGGGSPMGGGAEGVPWGGHPRAAGAGARRRSPTSAA